MSVAIQTTEKNVTQNVTVQKKHCDHIMGCPDNNSGMLNKVFIGGLVNTSHIALLSWSLLQTLQL